jgi:DNA-binding NtrC family response regulator
MARVLLVDDEQNFTSAMADYLRLQGHSVVSTNTLSAARDAIGRSIPDLVLLDLMLPDGSGLELLDGFTERRPQKIVLITGHSGVKSLIGAMAGDGVMYLQKPVEPKEVLGILNTLASADDNDAAAAEGEPHFGLLIGESPAMQAVYGAIEKVAVTDSTVLVQGESGTGKELVAEAIHRASKRRGPFVPVNCGGLSQELISSQLFGHEKGSFTGAGQKHVGFFERASGGTLFLDEITEMPIEMQTHLLRALETSRILRVGGAEEITVDARLVAATNREPMAAVRDGLLREDLYFRLSVFPIELPPLRERGDDVILLANEILSVLNEKQGTARQFSTEAIESLRRHRWPGNVRELKNATHRAFIMADDSAVDLPHLAAEAFPGDGLEGVRAGRSIADVERDLIYATLKHCDGDKKAAAASLGVSLKTLYNRLNQYEKPAAGD